MNGPRRPGIARWLARAGLLLVVLAWLPVLPHLHPGTELVRLRNALSLGPDMTMADDWPGTRPPPGFRAETVAPPRYFADVAAQLGLAALPDDWSRALAISRHLLTSAPQLNGGPVQRDLRGTHQAIVQRGDGYCGDFVRVFMAIANAAGMMVRPWAFSFDGFGGHGHILVDVWVSERSRWQLVDIYDNLYFVGRDERPLAALEARQRLLLGPGAMAIRPLVPDARPGFAIEAKAWEYFDRGLGQWYAPWGNNVHTVDASWPVRWFDGRSRSLEQLGTMVIGVQPPLRLIAESGNAPQRAALQALRWRLHAAALALAAGVLLLLLAWGLSRRAGQRQAAAAAGRRAGWPMVCVVGPLPPPSGGMANQCEQLLRLLHGEGVPVLHVNSNAPYRPALAGRVPVLRAAVRLAAYLPALWRQLGRADVVHLFANSGWAWHLLAAPALLVARLRHVPVIVNYRGGEAAAFLARTRTPVAAQLRTAAMRVVPSGFLREVFAQHGLDAEVIPNIVDLARFRPRPAREFGAAPHLIVTRNLEPIYDIPTALRAFAIVRRRFAQARLTVAGSGPERQALQALAAELGLADAVHFAGRIDNADIAALYASADLMLNASTVDNMPISILEALASGVPVVSTRAGGIPHLVEHEATALLVGVGDAEGLAAAALRLLTDRALAARLAERGVHEAARYAWPAVWPLWQRAYRRAAAAGGVPRVTLEQAS